MQGHADLTPPSVADAKAYAEQHGFEYLGPLTNPSLLDDPHRTRCNYCGRIAAQRLGDIGWGCQCQTNPRRAMQTSNLSGPGKPGTRAGKYLLKDSSLPVLEWWDNAANEASVWDTVTVRARREVFWRCPECNLKFSARVLDMVGYASCPDCSVKRKAERDAEYARLTVTAVADVPELAEAWADDADPQQVTVAGGGMTLRRFRCPKGHHPRITPLSFLRSGCPSCRGNQTRRERLEAVAADPTSHAMNREIAAQWHPTRNGNLKLETISPGSRRTVWWRSWECGHEWQATPAEREKGQRLRCPECRTILDSLAYHLPEVADEWSAQNPLTAWQVRPSGSTAFTPVWVCANNPNHTWSATLASRATGSGCPECREVGKSKVELAHHQAAIHAFGAASSGQAIIDEAFTHGARWLVDITAVTAAGLKVAIEYDGAYWHADKVTVDTAKSLDLLAAGWLVVRLREHPLRPLGIDHPRYAELTVHTTAPDPDGVIGRVHVWASTCTP
ncbi:zinc-ribbon domain-containing protein [Ornithinimicrobium sp. F0845]|uniref:zinc-ribbon domain-containing protein n=1 Tax=Ornithinimicrobium sp. F0845 TaxID=2926412 RepID=UPI001FF4A32B|nr:zinc-ribbon domain-containing protein [Ornithinimicrobium sp. F0845]MCK0113513.1 zinc-ribbon domain-containing protein [Ornithinimicrobium sp. F0845]